MARISIRLMDSLRSVTERALTVVVVVANVVACELGARIGLPGVDGSRVRAFFQGEHLSLLALYNFLAGGGVSRAGILALGVIPYFQAKLYLWIARRAFPALRRLTSDSRTQQIVVRVATVSLAALQAFGFAQFLQTIPGAVAEPGVGFVSRTILLITGGAMVVGWLAEMVGPAISDSPEGVRDINASSSRTATVRATIMTNSAAELPELPTVQLLESGGITEVPHRRAEHVEIPIGHTNL